MTEGYSFQLSSEMEYFLGVDKNKYPIEIRFMVVPRAARLSRQYCVHEGIWNYHATTPVADV